jgi:hypothetical protein
VADEDLQRQYQIKEELMLLFGCLLAFTASLAPRLVLILAWIFGSRWDSVWRGNWFWPLLGIIFAPYTTIMYLLSYTPGVGMTGWDWLWIGLGVVLDIMKWGQVANHRRGIPGFSEQRELSMPTSTLQERTAAEDQLSKLADLHDEGILTDEEYEAKVEQLNEQLRA